VLSKLFIFLYYDMRQAKKWGIFRNAANAIVTVCGPWLCGLLRCSSTAFASEPGD